MILRAVSCCCCCLFICSGFNNFLNLQQSAGRVGVCVWLCVGSPTKAKGHAAQSSDNNYGIRYYSYFLVIKFTAATTEAPFALIHSLSLSPAPFYTLPEVASESWKLRDAVTTLTCTTKAKQNKGKWQQNRYNNLRQVGNCRRRHCRRCCRLNHNAGCNSLGAAAMPHAPQMPH